MIRRALALAVLLVAISGGDAWAHASLESSEPAAGATLGAAPRVVRLTFGEPPDAALSAVQVLGPGGAAEHVGAATPVAGDPRTLAIGVRPLARGTYTVRYRAISADDGHASAGTITFGVRSDPGAAVGGGSATDEPAALEVAARFTLIAGLILLLGAAVAGAAGFGGAGGGDSRLALAGWLLAVAGLAALAVAEARGTDATAASLLGSDAGRGLLWRFAALAACGAGLVLTRQLPRLRRATLAATAVGALAAMGAHVAAGHAAASPARVAFGLVHFGAAGIWMGGLTALLFGLRGAPSQAKARAVRRFSALAGASLALVMGTGAVRATEELSAPGDLLSTPYGQAIGAKTLLVLAVVALAWRNRTHAVALAAKNLEPLRRISRLELALALGALMAAGTLGSVAPPVAARPIEPALSVAGSDAGRSISAHLTAASREPGANAFAVRARARDGRAPDGMRLRFTALDGPPERPTTLALRRTAEGAFAGTGGNLRFEGRWRIDVLVSRGDTVARVPLAVTALAARQYLSVLHVPGRPPQYTRMLRGLGYLRVTPVRRATGASPVHVRVFDIFEGEARVKRLWLTYMDGDVTRRQPVRRTGRGRFVARVPLGSGDDLLSVVAQRVDGSLMRGLFALDSR